jgi:N-methylhydantoinase A
MSTGQTVRIAVDIGGTFTDLQLLDTARGRLGDFKSPSTPDDPSRGLIAGLEGAAQRFGFSLADIGMLLHGSTIATNAVLERKLPRGALITTQGFTDVLEIGRHMRHNVYALKAEPRSVLIPRHFRFGIRERIGADGRLETPLDREQVRATGERLVEAGVKAVAVVFLHAYRNPAHEREAAEILSAIPGLEVSTSHEASPEIREFERTSTTVLNALLKPVISGYLERVKARLEAVGVSAPLYLVQSNGGVASPEDAARLPVKLLLSGPAGGAMAMADLARANGFDNMVGLDMGGTSSDVSVVIDGTVGETGEGAIDGLPVRLPMIEIRTVGAGGGSIARVEAGALRVGPESAGSMPGPACYQRGGESAAVTDANLVLGRIDPDRFLGGDMTLSAAKAEAAVGDVGRALGLEAEAAAAGIIDVANAGMAAAVRLSLFEKGADPADFVLAPFGGAGGLHACAVADELDIQRIVFPATASTLSARGILTTDLRHDLSHSELILAEDDAAAKLGDIVARLAGDARAMLASDGVPEADRVIRFFADCRYRGQAYEIVTPWQEAEAGGVIDAAAIKGLLGAFHDLHQTRYAHSAPDEPVEIVTIRAQAIGRISQRAGAAATPTAPPHDRVRTVHTGAEREEIPVLHRSHVGPEAIAGPLLIEEDYSTHYIARGWQVAAIGDGHLLGTRTRGKQA